MADRESPQGRGGAKAGGALLLAWIAAALGVPSAVAAVRWRTIGAHPVLGVVLLIVAAVLAGAGSLVRQLWRRKYNDRVVEWLGAGLDRRLARFSSRYRAHLLADLRYIDLKGLAGRFYTPELSEVYVDVALRPRDPAVVPSSDLPGVDLAGLPEAGQRRLLPELLGRPSPRVLAVIGAPGSGKTTLLRHTARELCLRRGRGRRIPVLLYLRDHAEAILADPKVALPALVGTALSRYGLAEPPGWLDGRLRAGECVVLLDGLDEVARQEDRLAVSEWVSAQVLRYPGNDFVVTSRPLGYQSAPVDAAITVQTQPFTPEQVSRFLHAWYLAVERHSTGAIGPDITRRARDEAEDLLARLRESPALHDLTVNPLLLTLIATVHRHHGALPGSRAELYAQICQVLLWRRQAAKKLAVEPRGQQKERIMRLLAFEMMRRQVRDLATAEAAAIVRPALRRTAKDQAVTAAEFLDEAASNGLFIERENGVRAFAHLTFQEYLAAAHIREKNLQDLLAGAAGDTWWRETTLLYAAGADAGPIVQACLAADTVPALALAFDCAEEAGELDENLRDQLESIRSAGLSRDADPQRRRLMTGITITRQLRRVIYGNSGVRICAQPVPGSIYQYFLEDMAARGQHRPPDAPAQTQPGTENRPAAGMRGSDAAEFVGWVNDITGGQLRYRLPARAEIQDPAIREALTSQLDPAAYGIWLAPGQPGQPPQLCPPGSMAFPWTLNGIQIQQRLKADFSDTPLACALLPLLTRAGTEDDSRRELVTDIYDTGLNPSIVLFLVLYLGLTRALDLVRALGIAPALARDLALALALARDVAADLAVAHGIAVALARDPDRALARALARASADARALAASLDPALAADLALARDRAAGLDPALAAALALARDLAAGLALARDRAAGLALDRGLATDLALALDLAPARDLVYDLDLARPRDLDRALDRALAPARDLDHALARALASGGVPVTYLGRALSATFTEVFSAPTAERISLSRAGDMLAESFCRASGIGPEDYVISPDLLAETVSSAISEAKTRLAGSDLPSAGWARLVTANLESLAAGIAARTQPVTPDTASACRMMALALAAEASDLSPDLSGMFRQIATAVTWLERRHTGAAPPMEVIVLALD